MGFQGEGQGRERGKKGGEEHKGKEKQRRNKGPSLSPVAHLLFLSQSCSVSRGPGACPRHRAVAKASLGLDHQAIPLDPK